MRGSRKPHHYSAVITTTRTKLLRLPDITKPERNRRRRFYRRGKGKGGDFVSGRTATIKRQNNSKHTLANQGKSSYITLLKSLHFSTETKQKNKNEAKKPKIKEKDGVRNIA